MRAARTCVALLAGVVACGDAPREMPADTALATPSAGDTVAARDSVGPSADITDSASASADTRPVSVVLVADSVAGDIIFNRRGTCFTCHGERGVGMPNLGPDLRDATSLHGDGSFRSILRVITDGVAVPKASPIGMPSFEGRLTEAQRYHVAAYVYSLSHPGSVVTDTATARTDTLSPFTIPAPATPPR